MGERYWSPTCIKRVQRCDVDSSTNPVVVLTDKGTGYFKALGNPEGAHVLAREFVGTSLATVLGLPTFEYSIIYFDGNQDIQFVKNGISCGTAERGHGFITREVQGNVWDGSPESLECIINPRDITRLVCLDTWVRNRDRYFLFQDGKIHTRIDNVFLRGDSKNKQKDDMTLVASDFTHALFCDGKTTLKANDEMVYGLFPAFEKFLDNWASPSDRRTIASQRLSDDFW